MAIVVALRSQCTCETFPLQNPSKKSPTTETAIDSHKALLAGRNIYGKTTKNPLKR
jgi:hypothetical protein